MARRRSEGIPCGRHLRILRAEKKVPWCFHMNSFKRVACFSILSRTGSTDDLNWFLKHVCHPKMRNSPDREWFSETQASFDTWTQTIEYYRDRGLGTETIKHRALSDEKNTITIPVLSSLHSRFVRPVCRVLYITVHTVQRNVDHTTPTSRHYDHGELNSCCSLCGLLSGRVLSQKGLTILHVWVNVR